MRGSLIRSGCLIHNGTYLTLSLTLTITLTLPTLTFTVRVTLTLLTLLTIILDIGLSNPRIIEPSDYRYITLAITMQCSTHKLHGVNANHQQQQLHLAGRAVSHTDVRKCCAVHGVLFAPGKVRAIRKLARHTGNRVNNCVTADPSNYSGSHHSIEQTRN